MNFPFGFGQKSSLLLIFFFHGIVFSLLLLRKGILYNNKASKWLSFLLFLCAMYIAPYMLGYANWYANKVTIEILFFIPFMQVLLIGPVIYFYTKSLLNPSFKIDKKDRLHFIPALLYLAYSLVVFVTDKLILDEFYFYSDGRDKDLANWYQTAGVISMSYYLILSLKHYSTYKKLVFDKVSFADSILFQWIQNFLIAFLSIIILRVLLFVLNPEWGEFGSQFWHYIVFSFVVFYISINGYANAVKMSFLNDVNSKNVNVFSELEIDDKPKQETLNQKELDLWKEKILQLIKVDKIYENPKLTLSDVSKRLETNPKTISNSINSGFEMNFNDFINHYRIEAVKEKLKKGAHKKSTLLGIAFDCGFNSKATFNRAFKKSTAESPKDYLQKLS
ncbi:helix-turn-helix domain-containing protein [Polaribacter dokdonensis]|uniref:Regulatory helix-turn-helix protein, AraC family n=1 Tax=Polaribacter dokdonensis DSW-5 TaxID=1300348 RepID=A0A0M9CFR6_9FLAO|nr:helix-turn-helix domain-containing protein [Polaribacter dokdonensis]KOY51573.1 Regulatory helix-turn-helix protein, AraC family [Polaribacter dokdonensis DSW-5]SEE08269.1 transcriptional regulator, AraC family [Polaribacter dokdonensis DSW-5]